MERGKHSGSYKGKNGPKFSELILRLDVDGPTSMGMLSGELNQWITAEQYEYRTVRRYSFVSEIRKVPEERETYHVRTPIRFYKLPELSGTIAIEVKDGLGRATLVLTGYGYHAEEIRFDPIHRESRYFRTIDVEIDHETGIPAPGAYEPTDEPVPAEPSKQPDRPFTLESLYAHAGIRVRRHGEWASEVERPPDGTWTKPELNNIMEEWFALRRDELTWNVYLLCAGSYEDPDVTGLMWDDLGPRLRQGAALFYDTIKKHTEEKYLARNYLRTAVHELGHALNLLHSFDNGLASAFGYGDNWFMLPRPAALSHMNYPWRYPYGYNRPPDHDGTEAFWHRFEWSFDDIELQHLRHHDRQDVMFGGDPLGGEAHEVVFGENESEVDAFRRSSKVVLNLRGKRVMRDEVRRFDLMEPIRLGLKLTTKQDELILGSPLDADRNSLAIYVKNPGGIVRRFRPVASACTAGVSTRRSRDPRRRISRTLPIYTMADLTYGRDGFYFSNPGTYLVRAVFRGGENLVAYSNPLRVQVGAPKSVQEEKLAADFFEPAKGRLLATGPTSAPRFDRQIEFFRRLESDLRGTAAGRAMAGYLGESLGQRFKLLHRKPGGESSIETIEPRAEEAMVYLNRALGVSDDGKLDLTGEASPGNLSRRRMAMRRASLAAMMEDLVGAERILESMRNHVKTVIGADRPALLKRELLDIDNLEFRIRSGRVR